MSQKVYLAERVIYASKAMRIAKASRLGIVVSAVLTFLIFAISYYGEVVGNMTVAASKTAQNAQITLYDDFATKDYTNRLMAQKVDIKDGMTALCGTQYSAFTLGSSVCVPSDEVVTSVDGSNNGESYLAYTFYLQNLGDYPVDLNASVNVISTTKGADQAVRFRVIIDGVGTTYAKVQTSKGAAPGELEPLTSAFYALNEVMYQEFNSFQPGAIMKITILLWYEGEDADHTINIIGGGVKLDMKFDVSRVYNQYGE